MSRDKLLTRCAVESRIADGDWLVIYHNKVLKLNNWAPRHPGGDKAIQHMVGRNASDEMDVYHSDETIKTFGTYQVGKIEGEWRNFTPPIQGGSFRTQQEIELDEGVVLSDNEEDELDDDDIIRKVIETYDRKLVKEDIENLPSLDMETQKSIQQKFRQMHKEFVEEGFFQCTYWGYAREFSRISTLFFLSYLTFKTESNWSLFFSAICMGLAWHQLTFIAHDAGHMGITHHYQIDNIVGVLIADFMGGLSVGWWKNNHNVHHLVTNDPVADPDIQHLPFFAVSSKLFGSVKSTFYDKVLWYDAVAKMLIPFQNWTYYLILSFGRFNLYRLSWEYLIKGIGPRHGKGAWLRYFEILGMAVFAYWFGYLVIYNSLETNWQRFLYVMVTHVVTMPLHVQITLSHFAMSTSNLGPVESFPQHQLRTSMDVDCPAWLDFIHGGLQFQAIHHLFPRMPRHNLRAAQAKVIKFCDEVGLKYTIYGFTRGNVHVINKLGDVAKQAKILADCTKHCQEQAVKTKSL